MTALPQRKYHSFFLRYRRKTKNIYIDSSAVHVLNLSWRTPNSIRRNVYWRNCGRRMSFAAEARLLFFSSSRILLLDCVHVRRAIILNHVLWFNDLK